MIKTASYLCLVIFLATFACGRNKRPGLSDKELFTQKETTDTVRQTPKDSTIEETYVVPPGIKYKESRAVDPANPPVVLDIANRKLNIRKFNLNDYYTKVRYIKLKHPMPATEGNFLFDAYYYYEGSGLGGVSGRGLNSRFSFMKDSIVAGDVFFGFYSYDYDGKFLHTIKTFDFPKVYDASQNNITYNFDDYKRAMEKGSTNRRNNNRFWVDDETRGRYVYNRADTTNKDFLFTFTLKGDTLCRFKNYNPKPDKKGPPISWNDPLNFYFYDGKVTIRQSMNDTVYRIIAPNRLVPAYVLNFGHYKLDISLAEDFSNKFFPDKWIETDKYVLFTYNQNHDTWNNRKDGSVKFFYSYYDKKSLQFYYFCEGTTIPEQEFFIENPLPDGLPFILSYVDISENQLRVFYSKKRLENLIKNKQFASLSPELQNKLKTMQSDLGESEVLIMILE